jgi:hypothetical protein
VGQGTESLEMEGLILCQWNLNLTTV